MHFCTGTMRPTGDCVASQLILDLMVAKMHFGYDCGFTVIVAKMQCYFFCCGFLLCKKTSLLQLREARCVYKTKNKFYPQFFICFLNIFIILTFVSLKYKQNICLHFKETFCFIKFKIFFNFYEVKMAEGIFVLDQNETWPSIRSWHLVVLTSCQKLFWHQKTKHSKMYKDKEAWWLCKNAVNKKWI